MSLSFFSYLARSKYLSFFSILSFAQSDQPEQKNPLDEKLFFLLLIIHYHNYCCCCCYISCEFFSPGLIGGLSMMSKRLQVSKTVLNIIADLNNAVIWKDLILPLISNSSSPFFKHLWTFLKIPTIIDARFTRVFLFFFYCMAKYEYLSIFSLSFIPWYGPPELKILWHDWWHSLLWVWVPVKGLFCLFWHETHTKGLRARFPTTPEEDEGRKIPEGTEGDRTEKGRGQGGGQTRAVGRREQELELVDSEAGLANVRGWVSVPRGFVGI